MGFYFFAISETLKPGTVPGSLGLWQSTRTLGLSQIPGTVPGLWNCPRVPTPWGFIFSQTISRKIKTQTCVGFWVFGTVQKSWDCSKDPEF